jgi:predicted component of type VI protein secretion system
MITVRLFRQGDPPQEIGSRVLTGGEIALGRGEGSDWVIPDPTKTLSRRHCVLGLSDGVVSLRDESTNGVFLGDGQRFPNGVATPVAMGETIALGAFLIRLEPTQPAQPLKKASKPATTLPLVSDGSPAGKLLDAFCSGAQIDSSVLSAEDPTEVMKRLGAIYREMVLGLGELMNERTRAKARFGLKWTAVQALDNNPFRWAPPQRVAIDLLQARQDGFLTSDAAVKASFDDLSDHQARLLAASRAAIEAVLADLAPEAVAQSSKGGAFLRKKKLEALWAEYALAHAKACEELKAWSEGGASRAFGEAYSQGLPEPQPPPGASDDARPGPVPISPAA